MFKPVKAKTVAEYLAAVPEGRKKTVRFLHGFIQKVSPRFKSHFAYNMLGYGSFPYLNYKKETVQWPIVALASQKQYLSLYICAFEQGQYVAEKYRKELGRVSVGKSCIRFRKLEDLNLPGLHRVLRVAVRFPGLVASGTLKQTNKKSTRSSFRNSWGENTV